MSWNRVVDYDELKICIYSDAFFSSIKGPTIAFFINDDETREAIKSNDERIKNALLWSISDDCKDYVTAIQLTDSYLLDDIFRNSGEDGLIELLDNKYLLDRTRNEISKELTRIRGKAKKKKLIRNRRTDFNKVRDQLLLALIDRDGYKCKECGASNNISIDHIIPLSKGGSDELDNLQLLCKSCNSKKGNRT